MPGEASAPGHRDAVNGGSGIRCDACRSILNSPGQETVSFLLVDDLRIPLVGCDAHLETFRSFCGMTTAETARLLAYRPAGGLTCPGCENAPQTTAQTMLPVQDGALALIACPKHQAAATHRFHTGLHTHNYLTTSLNTHTP